METEIYLSSQFAAYYQKHSHTIRMPPASEDREFAFFWFTRTGTLRHIGFPERKDLCDLLANEGPAHAFYSAAYYETPDAPQMPLKGWKGADLIFDIDADHLDLDCQKQHDWWWCPHCGHQGSGKRPEICPHCNTSGLQEQKWMCEECLGVAKEEAVKVVENFLVPDFGIARQDIMVVFSGHRGYHVHSYAKDLHSLGSAERREITDYIQGTGFDFRFHGIIDTSQGDSKGPDVRIPGWEQKLAHGIQNIFQYPEQLEGISGLRPQQQKILKEEAPTILKQLMNDPPRYFMPRGIGKTTWKTIAQFVIGRIGAAIDEPVTTDIHRLIRLPGSLNGKTGFLVKQLDTRALEAFDPFRHAQVFKGTAKVFVVKSPAFRLGGVKYPAMREIKKELPLSVAILLLCKGVAQIIE